MIGWHGTKTEGGKSDQNPEPKVHERLDLNNSCIDVRAYGNLTSGSVIVLQTNPNVP
jgi:hypothetical protein